MDLDHTSRRRRCTRSMKFNRATICRGNNKTTRTSATAEAVLRATARRTTGKTISAHRALVGTPRARSTMSYGSARRGAEHGFDRPLRQRQGRFTFVWRGRGNGTAPKNSVELFVASTFVCIRRRNEFSRSDETNDHSFGETGNY